MAEPPRLLSIKEAAEAVSPDLAPNAFKREAAETALAEFLAEQRQRPSGPRRPDRYLVPDLLSEYVEEHGSEADGVLIVLTIAHLDHQERNNIRGNLAGLCQLCHNRHDAPQRRRNAAATRRARMADGDLFATAEVA